MKTMPESKTLQVLHVEDDRYDALLLADLLSEGGHKEIQLTRADTLFKARALLKERPYDLILLDLVLPDERGINTLLAVRCSAPDVPVVTLTSLADFATAKEAVACGAEDYSVKGRDSAQELARKMYCAIERHRNRLIVHQRMAEVSMENSRLHDLAELDPLSGLLNRRGLEARLQELSRESGPGYVILLDVDDFKSVNDRLGHQAGDQILCEVAGRINSVKAEGLAAARIGGDEFLLLGLGDRDQAMQKALELQSSLELSAVLLTAGLGQGVTCCQAVCELPSLKNVNIPSLLALTHQALIHAKSHGKAMISRGWELPSEGTRL